ncbi:hypothetical protein FS749_004199 [Ceratobasidium sp. UAMH 11750]|nr:hypothetical protein FS749_004199 [Ceratobasidium sp. UAMH 11750]
MSEQARDLVSAVTHLILTTTRGWPAAPQPIYFGHTSQYQLEVATTPSSPLRAMFKSRPSGGMLGSVGAKIAHTSTLPGLGNQDLRTLQELITAEKGVLIGVQRLAGDVAKGAEALKNWGMGEGDDLGDVLGHSTNLLAEFSAALTQFAAHEERIRLQLKSIRTREENLDEMKRRKRNVDGKSESADRKLAKMGSEHKGRLAQVELLNELKQEGRQLEIDILNEEAAIGDYKRRTTRELMALKFAGLVELAEKTTIIGDLGKLMIEEISLQTTQPGHPRPPYTGRQQTAELSTEAKRCIDGVRLALPELPDPGPAPAGNRDPYDAGYDVGAALNHAGEASGAPYSEFGEGGFDRASVRTGDRIGDSPGNQYNTFPSSRNPSHFGVGPPTLGHSEHDREPTFSSSIADALAYEPHFSASDQAPAVPPHQPSVPSGTFAPPSGPPPGPAHQPSESYFSRALPDPNATSPLPVAPAMEPSPWATVPSSPSKSRPLPVVQTPQAPQPQPQPDQGVSEPAYARDEASSSPTGAGRRTYRRKNSGEFNYPYSDDAFFVRNHAASSRPLHNDAPSPEPTSNHSHEQDQHQITSAAAREVSREMDVLAMAPYASSPPRPAPASTYGTPSEFPNTLPNPHGGSPLPRTPLASTSPVPSLPPLTPVPAISSPPALSSPISTTRTIPASAFRRNMSRGDTLDAGAGMQGSVSPLSVKKKGMGEDTSRGSSPVPLSPGAPPLYQPVDPEGTLSFGRERSLSPPMRDRKPSDRGDPAWP